MVDGSSLPQTTCNGKEKVDPFKTCGQVAFIIKIEFFSTVSPTIVEQQYNYLSLILSEFSINIGLETFFISKLVFKIRHIGLS